MSFDVKIKVPHKVGNGSIRNSFLTTSWAKHKVMPTKVKHPHRP